ncbi:magnesium/cobalt transporter CorA [Synechocystis sp. LKSZ1]|uniref:magnesium/cobalt transporter CorA n=1 Tax=Synechocystis sp. LKSZ1 TaxID=3144951 RepID=UPI00336BF44A
MISWKKSPFDDFMTNSVTSLNNEEIDLFDYYYNQPGSAPGTVQIAPDAYPTEISVIDYGAEHLHRAHRLSPKECLAFSQGEDSVTWIDVQGLGSEPLLRELADCFHLPPLILEDIVNVPQRPKIEYHEDFLLIIAQMVIAKPGDGFWIEQISFVLGKNYLITLQEEPLRDPFEPVRHRLAKGIGPIRRLNADYLCYALLDAIIDNFFPVLELYGDRLEKLETEAVTHPDETTLNGIYEVRRELLALRRTIWPQREIFNTLIRDNAVLISPTVINYFRDCYDHTIQIIDVIETYRELASSLMDVYLSAMSQKMNEIMKVLTIISTVFIPLTFIAGIYGMNFNTEKSPFNMPELNWYWGYALCLTVMLIIAASLLLIFWKRGWFRRQPLGLRSRQTRG